MLVFTAASLEHLAERQIEAADVVDAVYTASMGRHAYGGAAAVTGNAGS